MIKGKKIMVKDHNGEYTRLYYSDVRERALRNTMKWLDLENRQYIVEDAELEYAVMDSEGGLYSYLIKNDPRYKEAKENKDIKLVRVHDLEQLPKMERVDAWHNSYSMWLAR